MYLLHHNPACAPKRLAGKFATLADAMAVASRSPAYLGDGDPTDWKTAVNIPGKLFLDVAAYLDPDDDGDEIPPPLWIIEAPGVARELAGLMTTGQLDGRSWSTSDPYFFTATAEMLLHLEAWCAPAAVPGMMHAAGVRLAAWYATSDAPDLGPLFLRGPEISQIITAAAAEAGATLDRSQVGTLTAAVAARLAFYGIRIVPDPAGRGDHRGESRYWIIEAPGVARELIAALGDEEVISRRWSAADDMIKAAARDLLPPAGPAGQVVCALLAAHYAAAGELSPALINAVIADTYLVNGVALPLDTIVATTCQVIARLRTGGLPVADRTTGRELDALSALVAATGPGKPAYWLWRGDEEHTGGGWGRPAGCFTSLDDAMSATGHLVNAHWHTTAGLPGLLFLTDTATGEDDPSKVPLWTIEASGVGREFADRCSPELRAARHWSPFDQRIIAAMMNATCDAAATWLLAPWRAIDAGVRLAAWYGTGRGADGSLSTVDVHTVIDDAYFAAYPDRDVPTAVIDQIAATLVCQLCEVGASIFGGRAAMLPPPPGPCTTVTVVDLEAPGTHPYRVHLFGGVNAVGWRIWDRLGGYEDRFWAWWRRPVWTVPIPAGRLPARLCRALSNLISGWVIPLGVILGGLYATWYLADGPATSGWASFWDLSSWVAWWDGAVQTGMWPPFVAFLLGWYLAGCVARKLIRLELRPAQRETAGTS